MKAKISDLENIIAALKSEVSKNALTKTTLEHEGN